MKASGILLFIFAVFALLAGVSFAFPQDGMEVLGRTFRFPSVSEVLSTSDEVSDSPETIIARRQSAVEKARKDDFRNFIESDPARFYLPDGDVTFFDPFFSSLDNASAKLVRIVHFGDSQIEIDRISRVIRDSLQSRFGGGGPGLLPVLDEYRTMSILEESDVSPERFLVYGPEDTKIEGKDYGIMGAISRFDTSAVISFSPVKSNTGPGRYFKRLTLLSSGGEIFVTNRNRTVNVEASEKVRHIRFDLPDSTVRTSVSFSGHHDVYGIILDCGNGVSLDNIAMRGSSGTNFTSISSAQLKDYFSSEDVKLIILQYGGNVVPYANTAQSISSYKKAVMRQIAYIKKQAPDAAVLFIGPSDMSTTIKGKMQSYPNLPQLVDSLKDAANAGGAAYWDMYGAMGGEGSMHRWAETNPPLAGSDHIHFTGRGAETIGKMFTESLILYYEFYRFRLD